MIFGLLLFAIDAAALGCPTGCDGGFGATRGLRDHGFGLALNDSSTMGFDANECLSPLPGPIAYFREYYGEVFDRWNASVIFPPLSVTSVNYLRNGPTISRYRRCVGRSGRCSFDLRDPFVVCTKRSLCKVLTRAQFTASVVATIKIIVGFPALKISDRALVVINSIYDAAVATDATVEHLINFTSIALHNIYLFTNFPDVDVCNLSFGCVSRGLLQLLSLNAYEKITIVSTINYLERPYLLDTFSSVTIKDEFNVFLRFYSANLSGIDSYIASVQLLESPEAQLVNQVSATEVLLGIYVPTDELQFRVLRRFNIYYVLSAQIFINTTSNSGCTSSPIIGCKTVKGY